MTAQVTGGKVCPDGQSLHHTVFQRSQRGVVNSNLLERCGDSTGWHFSFLCFLPCFRDFFARLTVFLILQGAIRRGRRPHFPPLFPLLRSLFDLTLQMPPVSAVPRATRDRFLDVSASRGNRRPCRPSQVTKRDIFFLTGQSNPLHRLQLYPRQFWTRNGGVVEIQTLVNCQSGVQWLSANPDGNKCYTFNNVTVPGSELTRSTSWWTRQRPGPGSPVGQGNGPNGSSSRGAVEPLHRLRLHTSSILSQEQ